MVLTQSECEKSDPDDYPDTNVFFESMGGFALTLYIISSLIFGILVGEFILLTLYILRHVPHKRQISTLWVTSVHLVASLMALISIIAPKASEFVWTFYKGYLGITLWNFVIMTIAWHGGENKMVSRMEGRNINMRIAPCCCLCCLPKTSR